MPFTRAVNYEKKGELDPIIWLIVIYGVPKYDWKMKHLLIWQYPFCEQLKSLLHFLGVLYSRKMPTRIPRILSKAGGIIKLGFYLKVLEVVEC